VGSTFRSRKDLHQFGDFAALLIRIPAGDGVLDTMSDVIAQNLLLNPAQCRASGADLGDDIDTVTVFLDHTRNAAHLSLDPAEAFGAGAFGVILHG
jgi:hypothetical protein